MCLPPGAWPIPRSRPDPNTKFLSGPFGGCRTHINDRPADPVPSDPAPAPPAHRSSGACRMPSCTGKRARWPADESSAQDFQHRTQRISAHAHSHAQPLASRQNQFERLTHVWRLLPASGLHNSESHRIFFSEPFPPNIEGLLANTVIFAESSYRYSTLLLFGNPGAPICASVRRPDAGSFHPTNIRLSSLAE